MAANKEQVTRFISGEISKCSLSQPDRFGKYSLLIKGAYEDTFEPFDGFVSSKSKINVFRQGETNTVDPSITDGIKFKGRIQVAEVVYDDAKDKKFRFLNAVLFDEKTGEDEASTGSANPFLDNPLN